MCYMNCAECLAASQYYVIGLRIDVAYCYRRSSVVFRLSVCRSVYHDRELCKKR